MSLRRLIAEARVLAGGEHECAALGHDWEAFGGRRCPRNPDANCSQIVFRCRSCGTYDYGEPGGPGHNHCVVNGPCHHSCADQQEGAR